MTRVIPYFSCLAALAAFILSGSSSAPANSEGEAADVVNFLDLDDSEISGLVKVLGLIENIIDVEGTTPQKPPIQDPLPTVEAVTVTPAPVPETVLLLTVPANKPTEEQKINLVYNAIVNISFNIECPDDMERCEELMAALDLENIAIQTDAQLRLESRWNDILQKQFTATALAEGMEQEEKVYLTLEDPAGPILEDAVDPNLEAILAKLEAESPSVDNLEELDASPPKPNIHNVLWSTSLSQGAWVHVNYMEEYHRMTVSAKEDDSALENLGNIIAKYASSAPPMQRTPAVDEIVIGPHDDDLYYRGKVTAIEGDMIDMELLDYGSHTKAQVSELKELNSEILAHPIYGIVMVMADVPMGIDTAKILDYAGYPADGQVEILTQFAGTITGRLWISEDSSWNDVINGYLASVGEQ